MVYFGNKEFKKPRRGIFGEALFLVGVATIGLLVLVIAMQGTSPTTEHTVQVGDQQIQIDERDFPSENTPPLEFPTIPPPQPARPFVEAEWVLGEVSNGGVRDHPPLQERVALAYLLHRFRSENEGPLEQRIPPQPIEPAIPDWPDIPMESTSMRGKRYPLHLTVVRAPLYAEARLDEDNPSGVVDYFEVWAADMNRHLHLVQFLRYDNPIEEGEGFYVEADFLRIHEYQPVTPKLAIAPVPQWVAYRLEVPVGGLTPPPQNSLALLMVAIGLGVVAIVVLSQLRQGSRKAMKLSSLSKTQKPSATE